MKRIPINTLAQHTNETLTIEGFVENIRNLQYVQFLILKDETGKVQITIEKNEENQELTSIVDNLSLESTIRVTGTVFENEKVKLNGREVVPERIVVTSFSEKELPLAIKDKENALRETRLDYRFLDLRREENYLFFKCQTLLEMALREYWIKEGYLEIHSPKISAKAAESGAEVFSLDYFGQKACLSQSPQFYKQMAMSSGFNRVFEIGPAFRAENSHTSYHATEINMADVEISWIQSEEDVMEEEENLLRYALTRLKDTYGEEIKEKFGVEISDVSNPFPRITFEQAKKILKEEFGYIGENKEDFERKEENLLCEYAKEKYHSDFLFVTAYPFSARPFYHMLDEKGLTKSYDLLFKGIEITTGSQRENRIDILEKQVKEKGIALEDLSFYLEFFRYGCPPHGGFAIGIARLMMQIFEMDNIREATFIYRGPTRLNP